MSSAPNSPTLCRPQHLDRERLRAVLSDAQLSDVRFHEAVVATAPPKHPRAIQLLVLTGDAVLLLPLASFASPGTVTKLRLDRIEKVERVSAAATGQRGLLLVPESEVYRLRVSMDGRTTDWFISSFEPDSRVFTRLAHAHHIAFQRRLMRRRSEQRVGGLELAAQFQALLVEIVNASGEGERAELLRELGDATSGHAPLQQLVLADTTRLSSLRADGSLVECVGLPAFLLNILLDTSSSSDQPGRLELVLRVVELLTAVLFDSERLQLERRAFLLSVPVQALVDGLQRAVLDCYDGGRRMGASGRSKAWRAHWISLLDAQTALLLAIDDLVQTCEGGDDAVDSVPALVLTTVDSERWLEKLFKRICLSLAIAEQHAPALSDSTGNSGDGRDAQRWSLALWRHVELLDLLIESDPRRVVAHLRLRRRDYIDLYLRSERFLAALRSSDAPHLSDAAERLEGLTAALDAAVDGN